MRPRFLSTRDAGAPAAKPTLVRRRDTAPQDALYSAAILDVLIAALVLGISIMAFLIGRGWL